MSQKISVPKNFAPDIAIAAAAAAAGESGGGGREVWEYSGQAAMCQFTKEDDADGELEIAYLLRDFHQYVKERERTSSRSSRGPQQQQSLYGSSWGRKRRRSQPSSSVFAGGCSSSGAGCGAGRAAIDGPSSSHSPTSPLDFKSSIKAAAVLPASSSSSVKASITTKRILQKEHDMLTQERERLMGDFAKIESRRDELIAQNQLLKAKKQKLNSACEDGPRFPNPNPPHSAAPSESQQQFVHWNLTPNTAATNEVEIPTQSAVISHHSRHIQQNQQVVLLQPEFFQYQQMVGPTGIPDLNVSAEEYAAAAAAVAATMDWMPAQHQALDLESYHHSRRIAKERRRNRVMMIQKRKSGSGKLALGNV